MYLVDTNIFLEILLSQEKRKICKDFLRKNQNKLYVSDFSLHSIGVILFRLKKPEIYFDFINDVISKIEILSLPISDFENLNTIYKDFKLDFDDAYQASICKFYDLEIVTLDKDFRKLKNFPVNFL
ncbi:type II toxin-antitoxin system VapC family toxin [Bacteroidota bacterium]